MKKYLLPVALLVLMTVFYFLRNTADFNYSTLLTRAAIAIILIESVLVLALVVSIIKNSQKSFLYSALSFLVAVGASYLIFSYMKAPEWVFRIPNDPAMQRDSCPPGYILKDSKCSELR